MYSHTSSLIFLRASPSSTEISFCKVDRDLDFSPIREPDREILVLEIGLLSSGELIIYYDDDFAPFFSRDPLQKRRRDAYAYVRQLMRGTSVPTHNATGSRPNFITIPCVPQKYI